MNFNKVRLGNITFNTTTRSLTHKDGRSVRLRNKSKEVLIYLVQNPGRTVSKTEVLDTIWSDVIASDESLVQCIADIRRVIGKNARQIIETVPREGYRLNLPSQKTSGWYVNPVATTLIVFMAAAALWFLGNAPPPQSSPAIDNTQVQTSPSPPGTDNVEAYLEVLKGRVSADRFNSSESLIAERHFRRAIELDQNYARAYAELATLFAVRFENAWTVLADADKKKAFYFAEKAAELDPNLSLAHYALGRLHSVFANLDLAENHLERAMSLQPNNEDARAYYGVVKIFRGDAEEAAAILEPVILSHPNPPYWYYLSLGHAQLIMERYEAAESSLNKCLEIAENSPYCLRFLIALYGTTGRLEEARTAGQDYTSMGFDLSVSSIIALMNYHHPDDLRRLEVALRSAGLPD